MTAMHTDNRLRHLLLATGFAAVTLCVAPLCARAADPGGESVLPGSNMHRIVHGSRLRSLDNDAVHPGTPMMLDPGFGGFPFDVDGGQTHELQLRLSQPLVLGAGSQLRSNGDASVLGLDATLQVPLAGGLSLTGQAGQTLAEDQFQPLGSIHCHNGTLRPDSYTASGCRFVNEAAAQFDRRTLSMGAQFDLGNVSSSLHWFTSDAGYAPGAGPAAISPWRSSPLLDPDLAPLNIGSSLLADGGLASPLSGETSGIDLDFQVGFTTDQAGEIRLGLALTRIYDASFDALHDGFGNPLQWNIAAPFDTASMGIEWSRGAFSGGLRGYYREPVSFLDRSELDGMGTFDVHFTWRTPWNANLSVGASNVLNAGVENRPANDKTATADRFESIYGRIPYVRYQQDL